MRLRALLLLLALLAFVVVAANEGGEEEEQEVEEDDDVAVSEDSSTSLENEEATLDLMVSHLLPDNPFNMIVNGEPVPLLISVLNKNPFAVKVVGLEGRFTQPQDFSLIFRNISQMSYYAEILPNQETTIQYRFRTDFEPAELGLVVDLSVVDEKDRKFLANAYKQVLKVADPVESLFGPQMIFLYIVGLASLAGVVYLVQVAFFGGKKPTGRRSVDKGIPIVAALTQQKSLKKTSSGSSIIKPTDEGFDEDWIPAQHLAQINASKKKRS